MTKSVQESVPTNLNATRERKGREGRKEIPNNGGDAIAAR